MVKAHAKKEYVIDKLAEQHGHKVVSLTDIILCTVAYTRLIDPKK